MPETYSTEFESLLKALAKADVEFIIVFGVAWTIHGSVRLTLDLAIVYARTADNIERLVSALTPHKPYLRGHHQVFLFNGMSRPSMRVSTSR